MASDERLAPRGEEFRERAAAAKVTALPPDVVRELSQLSPVRATLSLVSTFGLVAVAVALAVRFPHPLVIVPALVAIAAGQHGLAILAHQSAHYRMYASRPLNDFVGRLAGTPLAVSMLTYRIIHRIHHNHLYEPIDPDLALMAGYPRGRWYLVRKLAKDLFGITLVKNYRYFFGQPQSGRDAKLDDTSSALRRAARRDRRFVICAQAVFLALALATGWWRLYLLLWVLPLTTLLQALLRLRAVCEHGAVTDTTTPLTGARTTLAPAWARFLIFPHHMNYHVEHHLYPSVPHYRLAECHRRLSECGALANAEVSPSLGRTFAKIFAAPAQARPVICVR